MNTFSANPSLANVLQAGSDAGGAPITNLGSISVNNGGTFGGNVDTSGVLSAGATAGNGDIRSYQVPGEYVSLTTVPGKSGLLRSNTSHFVYYDTNTGDTWVDAGFTSSSKVRISVQGTEVVSFGTGGITAPSGSGLALTSNGGSGGNGVKLPSDNLYLQQNAIVFDTAATTLMGTTMYGGIACVSTTGGFTPPSWNTGTTPGTADGQIVWDATAGHWYGWKSSSGWIQLD